MFVSDICEESKASIEDDSSSIINNNYINGQLNYIHL